MSFSWRCESSSEMVLWWPSTTPAGHSRTAFPWSIQISSGKIKSHNLLNYRDSQCAQTLQHRSHLVQSDGGVLVSLNVLSEACVLTKVYEMADGVSLQLKSPYSSGGPPWEKIFSSYKIAEPSSWHALQVRSGWAESVSFSGSREPTLIGLSDMKTSL